jgi:hypothetical protein
MLLRRSRERWCLVKAKLTDFEWPRKNAKNTNKAKYAGYFLCRLCFFAAN